MQVDLFLLHKGSVRAQELPLRMFLGLETFLLVDHFDPKFSLRSVKLVFTILSKKLLLLSYGGLHFRLKEATRRKTFRLIYDKAVDNLNYSRFLQRLR